MPQLQEYGQRGAIVSIRLQNFMTYTDVTLNPGPNLNMILGPNGSGKSAIVCSIIVGLAGDVSLTGRATSPAGLVKKGSDWASTYIELYNEERGNYVVERKIFITHRGESKLDHKSEWKLDGRVVKKTEIQLLTTRLNIKVDNLCQFLPQDSVATFVKMNSIELLTSTLKAVGDNQLVEDHAKLIELTEKFGAATVRLNRLKLDCEHNENNARRLEADVQKLKERKELKAKKKICDQKIHFVRYSEAKKSCDEGKAELDHLNTSLERLRGSSEPSKKKVDEYKQQGVKFQTIVDRCKSEIEQTLSDIECTKNEVYEKKFACEAEFASFKNKVRHETQRENNLKLRQQELVSLENRLVEEAFEDCSRQIAELETETASIKQKMMESNRSKQTFADELRDLVIKMERNRTDRDKLLAVREKRVNIIATRRRDAHRVMEWLSKNLHQFREQIYMPMMCEINVKNSQDAAAVEHAINENDLFAFVCQSEGDLKKFTGIVRRDLKAQVNVILMPEKTVADFERTTSQQSMPSCFRAYLKDLVTAPDAIMRYLCGNYNFHQIPVFEKCSDTQLKQLLDKHKRFYVERRFYNVMRSRYDNNLMTVADTIRPSRYLMFSIDVAGIERFNQEFQRLADERKAAEEGRANVIRKVDELKSQWDTLAEKLNDYRKKQDAKKRVQALIVICKNSIQRLENEKIDVDFERNTLGSAIKLINMEQMAQLDKLVELCQIYADLKVKLQLNTVYCHVSKDNHRIAKERYKSELKSTEQLEAEARRRAEENMLLERKARELMRIAASEIEGFDGGKLERRVERKFQTIEEATVETLENKIVELEARIAGICEDRGLLNEFERQTKELQDKRNRISELQAEIIELGEERGKIKQNWVPRLNDVIEEIDVHYQEFMRKLHYDGKVKLDFDERDSENFSTYGIMIMVKYRDNEQLISLSSTRQSGGERSVATMIYMLALQTKTTVPFRCVDEINQGMDKDNERKVFELLVQTADESSSQYFLVSPKLLSNLPYSEKMKIHVVFNGRNLDLAWSELGSDDDQAEENENEAAEGEVEEEEEVDAEVDAELDHNDANDNNHDDDDDETDNEELLVVKREGRRRRN